MVDGIYAWEKAKLPVETGDTRIVKTEPEAPAIVAPPVVDPVVPPVRPEPVPPIGAHAMHRDRLHLHLVTFGG